MNFTECKKPGNWGGEWWQSPKKARSSEASPPTEKKRTDKKKTPINLFFLTFILVCL